jgi:cell division protein ZapA (FtsZ GTPase activity inhibitor)
MSKKKVHVSIFDQSYSLVTDESEELLQKAAAVVDGRMKTISSAGFEDTQKVAVLVALQLAHELISSENDAQRCKDNYGSVAEKLREQDRIISDAL